MKNPMLKQQWPEGGQDITKVTKRPQTTATIFKNSMISLVDNLMKKVRKCRLLLFFCDIKCRDCVVCHYSSS